MKFRCPYCRRLFAELRRGTCPHCGRTAILPGARRPARPSAAALPDRGPAAGARRRGQPNPIALLAHNGFKLTAVLVILLFAGGALLNRAKTPPVDSTLRKIERSRLSLANLRVALELYRHDTGAYPETEDGLAALVVPPEGTVNWSGPYIHVLKNDLWGRPFRFAFEDGTIRLAADGPDAVTGTGDDIVMAEALFHFPPSGGMQAVVVFADGSRQVVVDKTAAPPPAFRTELIPVETPAP